MWKVEGIALIILGFLWELGSLTVERKVRFVSNRDLNITAEDVTRYIGYNEMLSYLRKLALVSSEKTGKPYMKLTRIGSSFENVPIFLVHISLDHSKNKPKILLDSGMHAREWEAPAVIMFFIYQLVTKAEDNSDLLGPFDILIIPMANPDGFIYSHQLNRLWRKTRSKGEGTNCVGVDGNRNFGFHWGGVGSSQDPCSDLFGGPFPFSEKETKIIKKVGSHFAKDLIGYVSFHSYGSFLLYPWGYTLDLPKDWERLDKCARMAAMGILSIRGTRYQVGSSARILYEAAGGSDDWFHGALKVPFAYTMELPATAEEGFRKKEEDLLPTARETFTGLRFLCHCMLHYLSNANMSLDALRVDLI